MKKKQNQDNSKISAATITNTPPAETLPKAAEKKMHELQVYQIELELQNDELHRVQSSLAESLDRYYELFEFAPICYLTLTEQGLITDANISCTKLLGVVRKQLVNRHCALYRTGK